jgi:hypothetical protein
MATTTPPDPRIDPIDRLYRLLPAIYRMRDADQKYPLQALLRVIAEQVNVVEDDITQLYDNWFIETAEEWAVPYVADLLGYRPVQEAGQPGDPASAQGRALNRFLIPRREVGNTIHNRRRKGAFALLELLARDVADWPARAVEFFRLLGWNQNLNHPHFDRAHTAGLREIASLDLMDGPFDSLAHTVDVRRINSRRALGRYNIPSVGLFVWRLKSYSVTRAPAFCAEGLGPHRFSFSVLGQDAPLFLNEEPETDPTHIAGQMNVPIPIRRIAFDQNKTLFYGVGKSFAIWANDWPGFDPKEPIPAEAIMPADLTDWQYTPPPRHVAVDPVLGRIAFPAGQFPRKGVKVSYHYGFSANMGGGEYPRELYEPVPREGDAPDPSGAGKTIRQIVPPKYYHVGPGQLRHLRDAFEKWNAQKPADAVIEVMDSSVYVEPLHITLGEGQTLQLRAAHGVRPVIRMLDWQTDMPDSLSVFMHARTRFTLDGFMLTGRSVHFYGPKPETPQESRAPICGSEIVIRHCTLVPGWGIDRNCKPDRPAEASLELYNIRARVRIEHSILGSIQINEDEVTADPIPLHIADSIVDAMWPEREAIGAPGYAVAHALLTIRRSTVFGIVDVHAVELAENAIFSACVNVARRQVGCMRFCYIQPGCRTPRRYRCQPDLVAQAVKETIPDSDKQEAEITCEQLRVRPQFTSERYGNPGYGQLALACAKEITRGADDESEMGAFHDLFQPQREANLRVRLEEFTPAGMDAGIIFVT